MSFQEVENLRLGLALGLPLASLLLGVIVLLPIWLGVNTARHKGISPRWMWLSLVAPPLGGWATYLAIVVLVRSTACAGCGRAVPRGSHRCPACHTPMAVTMAAVEDRRRTRRALWTGRVSCPGCKRSVAPNFDGCPHCGVPLPRIKCPDCGGHDTQLLHRPKALRFAGIVMLVFAGLLFVIAYNGRHGNTALAGPAFVAAVYLALTGLVIVPMLMISHWARPLFCRPCYYRHYRFRRLKPNQVTWHQPAAEERDDPETSPPEPTLTRDH
jgi:RNA polymerase subunit RPABC4/transcription elongation factor Spt4